MSKAADRKEKDKAMARELLSGSASTDIGRLPGRFARDSFEHQFGDVWQGDDLTLKERELVASTILVGLNREAEIRIDFNATMNFGLPRTRIEGMITHAGHHAGWPVAASGFRLLEEVWPAGSSAK